MSETDTPKLQNRLLFVGYNAKGSHFLCGTESGFFICQSNPFKEEAIKSFNDGGIGVVEFIDEMEKIVALVGGGSRPAFPLNKVIFYNYDTKALKGEMLCRQNIITIKSRNKYLAVVAEDCIYLYDNRNELIKTFKTYSNPLGIVSFVHYKKSKKCILAYPHERKGWIQLVELPEPQALEQAKSKKNEPIKDDLFPSVSFKAHEGALRVITLNKKGTKIASASETGTLIRMFDTRDGNNLFEFRRGNKQSTIFCIAISFDDEYVACISSSGTLHIFPTKEQISVPTSENQGIFARTSSSIMGAGMGLFNYYTNQEHKSLFKHHNIEGPCICTFLRKANNKLNVLSNNGKMMHLEFDYSKQGGESADFVQETIFHHKI